MAEQLRQQGKDAPARYAEQAADRAERLGDYLARADGDRILRDVEDFAPPQPVGGGGRRGGPRLHGFAAAQGLQQRALPLGTASRAHGAASPAASTPALRDDGPEENPLRDRPTGELLKELSDHTTTLVKQEMDLAKAELQEKGKQAGIGAGMFGGAGLFGVGAFAALTACLIAVAGHGHGRCGWLP